MAFFRNSSGHHISDKYSRGQALRFVIYVDLLLDLASQCQNAGHLP
jgi:hypothetical protein